MIYDIEEEQKAFLSQFILYGLERNEKIICILDGDNSDKIDGCMKKAGLDIGGYLASGQFVFESSDERYLKGGSFDPDRMLDNLRFETEKALAEGYSGMRIAGEMTWVLKKAPGWKRLMECEVKANKMFSRRTTVLCMYDRRRFDAETLLEFITAHPLVVLGTEICDNVAYIPPEELLSGDVSLHRLNNLIGNILAYNRGRKKEMEAQSETVRLFEVAEQSRKALLSMVEDVQKAEERLLFINRLLGVLTEINLIVSQETGLSVENLLKKTCGILYKDSTEIKIAASAGTGGVSAGEISMDNGGGFGENPELTAFVTGQAYVFRYDGDEENTPPYFINMAERGCRSCIILPLVINRRSRGVILVYSGNQEAFDPEEIKLLMELAGIISFAWEKIEMGEERNVLTEQLIRSEKLAAVGELVSGVAHEINNPLTGLLGISQLILMEQKGRMDKRTEDDINTIYQSGRRIEKIVLNLLRFARKEKVEKGPLKINEVLENVLNIKSYEMKVKNIEVEKQFRSGMPFVLGDMSQLEQVFMNIINNAEYVMLENGKGGKLTVRTYLGEGEKKEVIVEIEDTGPGIPTKILPNIFDPFFTTKPVGKGTGLGLPVSYGIIKEHGGEIYVANRERGGAVFTVKLPVGGDIYE